jgi:hypothetical protein
MKRMIALMIVGMFVIVGCGTAVMSEPDDPERPNRAPGAPIVIEDKSHVVKKEYQCYFYSVDPDGDDVYYELIWKKIDNEYATNEPDDPERPWLGPFTSGAEVNEVRNCDETGDYQLTIRAKDSYDNIGPSTTVTVSYTKSKFLQLPLFDFISARFPGIAYILTLIFNF